MCLLDFFFLLLFLAFSLSFFLLFYFLLRAGLLQTDDRIALKEMTRQLQLENAVGDRVFVSETLHLVLVLYKYCLCLNFVCFLLHVLPLLSFFFFFFACCIT